MRHPPLQKTLPIAFVCSLKGYHFKAISSDAFAKEKLQTMRLFGADVEIIASESGKITPDLIPKMVERANQLGGQPGVYLTRQFENRDVIKGYQQLGKEILDQLQGKIDAFCAGVGTAGMLTGVARELKKADAATRVVVLEPASAPLLSQGKKGSHRVEGIGMGIVPPLLSKENYNEIRLVEESQARETARILAREEGIFAGISSGLNVFAAIELGKELGPGHTVVTVACDSGMKYLAGDLYA